MFKELQSTSTTKVTKAEGILKRLKVKIRKRTIFLSGKSGNQRERGRTIKTLVVQ